MKAKTEKKTKNQDKTKSTINKIQKKKIYRRQMSSKNIACIFSENN